MRKTIVVVCSLLFAILIIATFMINGVCTVNGAVTNAEVLEKVYYVTQIVTAYCVVIGAIIGVWQYVLTTRAERNKLNTDCIQRAVDLAQYYKDNILSKYMVLTFVFEKTGLMKLISSIPRTGIRSFDEIELNQLLTQEQKDEINRIRSSEDFIKAVIEADKIFGLNLGIDQHAKVVEVDKEKEMFKIKIDGRVVLQKFMANILTETLNDLEYFCMHFTHETADESVVYQSLHQTYLEMVHILYYNIAVANKADGSKFYTNIIELYEKWNEREKEQRIQRSERIRETVQKGNVVQKI